MVFGKSHLNSLLATQLLNERRRRRGADQPKPRKDIVTRSGAGPEHLQVVPGTRTTCRENGIYLATNDRRDVGCPPRPSYSRSFTGSHEEFLAAWWFYANQRLHFNHMRDELWEQDVLKISPLKDYFDCGEEVFFMDLDQLREYCQFSPSAVARHENREPQ
jgi:hypothetical protein